MTNRTLNLLLALGCLILGIVLVLVGDSGVARGDRSTARILAAFILLSVVGVIYFLVGAFSKDRYRAISTTDPDHSESTKFFCPHCQKRLSYSKMPAFGTRFPCPHCGEDVTREEEPSARVARPKIAPSAAPSPEIPHELAQADDAPAGEPVVADTVRAAFAGQKEFTVAEDPDGWLILTATGGPPRWIDGPTPGTIVKQRQIARLRLTRGSLAAIRPESLLLTATHPDLCACACVALVPVFGPLKVRVLSADAWIVVGTDHAKLALRLITQRAAVLRSPLDLLFPPRRFE